jgi:hypothetical protein
MDGIKNMYFLYLWLLYMYIKLYIKSRFLFLFFLDIYYLHIYSTSYTFKQLLLLKITRIIANTYSYLTTTEGYSRKGVFIRDVMLISSLKKYISI